MLIRIPRRWEIPESRATPETLFLNRRAFVAGAATLGVMPAAHAQRVSDDPTMTAYPFKRSDTFTLDRAITPESVAINHNNFIEFGSGKRIQRAAQALPLRPWTITIDGLVEKPMEVGFDDLFKAMPIEERLYRFRCVETWAMAVPWTGFPFRALLDYAKPLSGAKFVRLETFEDRKIAPGQRSPLYDWPYVEALTMAEAANDLAMLVTGAYGKPLAKQAGAPLRLIVPWKYGFKSIKSIRKISFVDKRPTSLWESLQGGEYGFWANVNPEVPHVRWSQADEELLGSGERVKTQLFNGYAPEVAGLYKGVVGEKLYM